MNHDEHDELWELLGKAREPKSSPFFASKVLRAIREEPPRATFWQWLRRSWLVTSAATATAVVAVFFAVHHSTTPVRSGSAPERDLASVNLPSKAEPLAGLVDVMSDQDELATPLPELLATEDHSVWLQADLSSLF